MSTAKRLFVGGPWHGAMVTMDADQPAYAVIAGSVASLEITRIVYERQQLAMPRGGTVVVYMAGVGVEGPSVSRTLEAALIALGLVAP